MAGRGHAPTQPGEGERIGNTNGHSSAFSPKAESVFWWQVEGEAGHSGRLCVDPPNPHAGGPGWTGKRASLWRTCLSQWAELCCSNTLQLQERLAAHGSGKENGLLPKRNLSSMKVALRCGSSQLQSWRVYEIPLLISVQAPEPGSRVPGQVPRPQLTEGQVFKNQRLSCGNAPRPGEPSP